MVTETSKRYKSLYPGQGYDLSVYSLREGLSRVGYVPLPTLHVYRGEGIAALQIVRELRTPVHILDDLTEDQDEWYVEWMGEAVGSEGA